MEFEQTARRLRAQGIACVQQEPMSRHTSFGVGGPAALFIRPRGADQVGRTLALLGQGGLPWFLLGRGTNLLVADSPLPLAVVHLGRGFDAVTREDEQTVYAQAGAALMDVCRRARDWGLAGLEFAYGIPGAVGGGVYMNAGAYGGELKGVVARVDYLDEEGRLQTASGEALEFGYRHSAFTDRPRWILGAAFRLAPGDPEEIGVLMEDIYGRRKAKQPLEYSSAGSTFKRPEGAYAAALIDQCGLKGYRVGGAQVSEKHAGFILNRDGATCADILELIRQVQEKVYKETGFRLEREVKLLGGGD